MLDDNQMLIVLLGSNHSDRVFALRLSAQIQEKILPGKDNDSGCTMYIYLCAYYAYAYAYVSTPTPSIATPSWAGRKMLNGRVAAM